MRIEESNGVNPHLDTFYQGDEMYKKLERVASFLTAMSPRGFRYYVGETYLDYGQDWKWTTILADNGEDGYQALNPRQQERIFFADSISELHKIAEDILAHAYVDRIK